MMLLAKRHIEKDSHEEFNIPQEWKHDEFLQNIYGDTVISLLK